MNLLEYRRYGKACGQLYKSILAEKISHGYIFEGDFTTDKLGFAKAFSKGILCKNDRGIGCGKCPTCLQIEAESFPDLHIIRADGYASKGNLSIKDEEVISLQNKMKLKPVAGDRNIVIIQGADGMTVRAQNRFLKSLEEPVSGTVVVLLSENTENLLPTINSRCIKFRLISDAGMTAEDYSFPREIIEMVLNKKYFFDIKTRLDEELKDKEGALRFLDGIQKTFGIFLREGNSRFSEACLINCIDCVEKARGDIRQNVGYKYVIRNLILSLEEA